MKYIIVTVLVLSCLSSFGQTQDEKNILALSNRIFQWEVGGKTDSLERVFDEKFLVTSATGESKSKMQYIAQLRSGNFAHNAINVEENTATVSNNTATVVGKGTFVVTLNRKKITMRLSYIEVFSRSGVNQPWKVLAMHAGSLAKD